jgi:hypothetical protein
MVIKFKKERGEFITVERDAIDNDKFISFKAKGLLTYLMGRPNNWKPNIKEMVSHARDKEASVKSGISELKKAGYVEIKRFQDKKGLWGWEWSVCDRPIYERHQPKCTKSTFGEPKKPKVEKQLSEKKPIGVGETPTTESRKTESRKIDFDSNNDLKNNGNKREDTRVISHQDNIFKEVFKEIELNDFQAEEIKTTVKNFGVWRDTCKWWALQGYKATSIGRILEKYNENLKQLIEGSGDGLSNYDKAMSLIMES